MCGGAFGKFHVASTNRADQRMEQDNLRDQKEIVLSVTSVLALSELDLLRLAKGSEIQFIVAQSVLDVLDTSEEEKAVHPSLVVSKDHGSLVGEQISPERAENAKAFFRNLGIWLRKNAEVIGIARPPAGQYLKRMDLLTQSAVDSLLIAKQRKLVLLTEDLRLRILGRAEYTLRGASSVGLVKELASRGSISEEVASQKILRMIAWNYFFIPITGADIAAVFRCENHGVGAFTDLGLQTLSDPSIAAASAAVVVVDFVKEVWLEPLTSMQKTTALSAALRALSARGDWVQVSGLLRTVIESRFTVNPLHMHEIQIAIDAWRRANRIWHVLGEGRWESVHARRLRSTDGLTSSTCCGANRWPVTDRIRLKSRVKKKS